MRLTAFPFWAALVGTLNDHFVVINANIAAVVIVVTMLLIIAAVTIKLIIVRRALHVGRGRISIAGGVFLKVMAMPLIADTRPPNLATWLTFCTSHYTIFIGVRSSSFVECTVATVSISNVG
jgi:hypothetical protein